MENTEKVADFFARLINLTNQIKSCGEALKDQNLIEKVLRTFSPRFDHIVVAIEESKNLEKMSLEELQSSLEAHEIRLQERDGSTRQVNQALLASSKKTDNSNQKMKKQNWKGKKN